MWNLTSGVYLTCDAFANNLRYCFLPSTPNDVLQWTTIPKHTPIVELTWNRPRADVTHGAGMAINEHDLVVNVLWCVRLKPIL